MFWNKTKKISAQISATIQNEFGSSFIGSKYADQSGSGFKPPFGFYDDPYIRGLVSSLIVSIAHFGFKGATLSENQQGELHVMVWETLAEADAMRILSDISSDIAGGSQSPEFRRGEQEAMTLAGATFGVIKRDDPDPIYQEAIRLAPRIHDLLESLNQTANSSTVAIATAVRMLTIQKHVKEHYIQDS